MTALNSFCANKWPLMETSLKNRASGSYATCVSEPVCWSSAVMACLVLAIEVFKSISRLGAYSWRPRQAATLLICCAHIYFTPNGRKWSFTWPHPSRRYGQQLSYGLFWTTPIQPDDFFAEASVWPFAVSWTVRRLPTVLFFSRSFQMGKPLADPDGSEPPLGSLLF